MAEKESLGIKRIDAIHYYVHDLERSHKFYTQLMGFTEMARAGEDLEKEGKQRSALFQAGACKVVVSQPVGEGGRAWRFLKKRAEGVGTVIFEVEDAKRTFDVLEKRGGTPITEVQEFRDDAGTIRFFSITTPFGDATFRFVERNGYRAVAPGWEWLSGRGSDNVENGLGFQHFDHITSNFQTMAPAILWLEHVMGFERLWDIEFHTEDIRPRGHGTGLRSIVMWDPKSESKFANNEPYRPDFKRSQINIFNEEHGGDGIQHVALHVKDIVHTVPELQKRGIAFMPTPDAYYDALPKRLEELGVGQIDEDIEVLKKSRILVDGDGKHSYLLQIFLKESAGLYSDPSAGPFFYEIIQRKGDRGFGGGNFRALFESIEETQKTG